MSQSSTPPPTAIQRVTVFQTMREAYRAVFTSLPLLMRAAFLPYVLSVAIAFLSLFAVQNAFLTFVMTVFGFVPYTLFGVAWHRVTLLQGMEVPSLFPSWTARHWRFMGYAMALTGIAYLLWVLVFVTMAKIWGGQQIDAARGALLPLLGIAALGILVFLTMRISFVFPATAVDERYTLRDSWSHTSGQTLRLAATLFVTAMPIMILLMIANGIVSSAVLSGASTLPEGSTHEEALTHLMEENMGTLIVAQIVFSVFSYILMALMVSAISIAFRTCTGWVPLGAGGPPVAPTGTASS
jgi:hypothetical protein